MSLLISTLYIRIKLLPFIISKLKSIIKEEWLPTLKYRGVILATHSLILGDTQIESIWYLPLKNVVGRSWSENIYEVSKRVISQSTH